MENSENITSPCENDCSGNGFCHNNHCFCWPFYNQPSCEEQYRCIYPNWQNWMYLIQAIVLFTQSILLIHSGILLYSRIKRRYFMKINNKIFVKPEKDIITFILIGLVFASLIRIVHFSIDPHGYLHILPYGWNLILFNIPFLIWFDCVALLSFFWIDIQKRRLTTILWLTKFQPIWISFIIISAIVMLVPLIISVSVTSFLAVLISWVCYLAAIETFFVILISVNLYGGLKLLKSLKTSSSPIGSPNESQEKFLKKLTQMLVRLNINLFLALIFGFLWFIIYFLPNYQWSFLIVFTFEPIEEFIIVFIILWFLTTRKEDLFSRKETLENSKKKVSFPEYDPPSGTSNSIEKTK